MIFFTFTSADPEYSTPDDSTYGHHLSADLIQDAKWLAYKLVSSTDRNLQILEVDFSQFVSSISSSSSSSNSNNNTNNTHNNHNHNNNNNNNSSSSSNNVVNFEEMWDICSEEVKTNLVNSYLVAVVVKAPQRTPVEIIVTFKNNQKGSHRLHQSAKAATMSSTISANEMETDNQNTNFGN